MMNKYRPPFFENQYMVAVPLIFGKLTAESYEDSMAADPRIDALRNTMEVCENEQFTRNYFDPEKRGIGNAIQIFFNDGSSTERIEVQYPVGHRRRREEGIPLLLEKFEAVVDEHEFNISNTILTTEDCVFYKDLFYSISFIFWAFFFIEIILFVHFS